MARSNLLPFSFPQLSTVFLAFLLTRTLTFTSTSVFFFRGLPLGFFFIAVFRIRILAGIWTPSMIIVYELYHQVNQSLYTNRRPFCPSVPTQKTKANHHRRKPIDTPTNGKNGQKLLTIVFFKVFIVFYAVFCSYLLSQIFWTEVPFLPFCPALMCRIVPTCLRISLGQKVLTGLLSRFACTLCNLSFSPLVNHSRSS